jgi:hypothetical protein
MRSQRFQTPNQSMKKQKHCEITMARTIIFKRTIIILKQFEHGTNALETKKQGKYEKGTKGNS